MSRERINEVLRGFGFSRIDAQVYIYLAKKGPKSLTEVSEALDFTDRELAYSLKRLQRKGVVLSTAKQSQLFIAVTIESLLNKLMSTKMEQACNIKEAKVQLLSEWRANLKNESHTRS
jgi:sugar-specific transcriptional regulator TrmB